MKKVRPKTKARIDWRAVWNSEHGTKGNIRDGYGWVLGRSLKARLAHEWRSFKRVIEEEINRQLRGGK